MPTSQKKLELQQDGEYQLVSNYTKLYKNYWANQMSRHCQYMHDKSFGISTNESEQNFNFLWKPTGTSHCVLTVILCKNIRYVSAAFTNNWSHILLTIWQSNLDHFKSDIIIL